MSAFRFDAGGVTFDFTGDHTYVMGVINMSPESNNRQTIADSPASALQLARRYREHGVQVIDIGGQSSHYLAAELPVEMELSRLLPAIELLAGDGFVVSVDTWKPGVAHRALDAGASIINDTGGMRNAGMVDAVAARDVPVVVTYVEGETPLTVGDLEFVEDKALQVAQRFAPLVDSLTERGLTKLILDPGIAINYRSDYEEYTRQQLRVIRHIDAIRKLGHPVLVPIPRKRELSRVVAYVAMALEYGADMIRVHDPEEVCDVVRLFGREVP